MTAVIALVLACASRPQPQATPYVAKRQDMAKARPSGVVHDGVFTDEMYRFSLPIEEGWVAQPGPETGLMRVVVRHVATETRVELWAFSGTDLEPRIREGCDWTFKTKGRPRAFAEEVLLATCVPKDATARRVYGTIFVRDQTLFQAEIQPPNSSLLEGRQLGKALIDGLTW